MVSKTSTTTVREVASGEQPSDREARLAKALRHNLKRRKAQARARLDGEKGRAGPSDKLERPDKSQE